MFRHVLLSSVRRLCPGPGLITIPHRFGASTRPDTRSRATPFNTIGCQVCVTKLSEKDGSVVRILFAGRLSEEKRADRFLDMFAAVKRATSTPLRGIIAGTGP